MANFSQEWLAWLSASAKTPATRLLLKGRGESTREEVSAFLFSTIGAIFHLSAILLLFFSFFLFPFSFFFSCLVQLEALQQPPPGPPPVPAAVLQGVEQAGEAHDQEVANEALLLEAEPHQHNPVPMDDDYGDDYPPPEDVAMEDVENVDADDPMAAHPHAQAEDDLFWNSNFDPEEAGEEPEDDAEGSESDDSDEKEADDAADAEEAEDAGDAEAGDEQEAPPFFESPFLSEFAYPGCHRTLKQVLLMVLTFTSANKLTLQAIGDFLCLLCQLLPAGNRIPRTTYKLFQLLGLDVDRFERHVCSNDCHVFEDLDRSQYADHCNDACPVCQSPRFVKRGASWSPAKKFYALPLAPQIEALKRRPDFDTSVAKMWESLVFQDTFHDTFWGGSLAQPFLAQCHSLDDFQQLLLLCLGMDGVNAFKTSHAVWPVGVRVWNLHPEERNSKDFVLLTALIPGPKAPSNLGPYLKPLLEEVRATETAQAEIYNYSVPRPERLTLTVATSIQDQMSQIKSTEHIGPSGTVNCWRCGHESVPNAGAYLFIYLFFFLLLIIPPLR